MRKQSGFTLIEIMVVVVIVGVIITMATLALSAINGGRRVKMIAQQLQHSILAAKQQAVLLPQTLAMRVNDQGYQFYAYQRVADNRYGWKPFADDVLSHSQAFSGSVVVRLMQNDKRKTLSQIVFSQSGDISPFKMIVSDKRHQKNYQLAISNDGILKLKPISGMNQ